MLRGYLRACLFKHFALVFDYIFHVDYGTRFVVYEDLCLHNNTYICYCFLVIF